MTYRSVFKPGLFEGRTVIVTGGGSGIGRCTAHEIASLGAHVAITGRKQEKLDKVKAEIEAAGGTCETHVFDIREEAQVKEAVAGYGKADKPQMQEMVRMLLDLPSIPHPDDAADALAIAICHVHTARFMAIAQGGRQ